jgi:DNA anti-recombination protein RmuC
MLASVLATVENLKKDMVTIKTDLVQTTQHLNKTHSSVESVKNELINVMTSVENLKKDTNGKCYLSHKIRFPPAVIEEKT